MLKDNKFTRFIIPKIKFAMSGLVATLVDYVIYIILVLSLAPVFANIISYSIAVMVNFTIQRNFIFEVKRRTSHAFSLSIMFSLIGLVISSSLIYLFNEMTFFQSNQYVIKLVVTGIVFFYNFYTKRFAFENR